MMKKGEKKIEYYDLLCFVRTYIDRNYGSVTQFFNSEDAQKCGLKNTTQEKNKLMNYLSIPKEHAEKKVSSAPMLNKLMKGLLGIEVRVETTVTRITDIYLPQNLDLNKLEKKYLA
jgi:hypothetical protein